MGCSREDRYIYNQENQLKTPSDNFIGFAFHEVKWSEVAQSCPTLCDPMDCSLPGSSVHGIFQARVLEWIAISFSRGSARPRDRTQVSCMVDRRFTIWATREVLAFHSHIYFKELEKICLFCILFIYCSVSLSEVPNFLLIPFFCLYNFFLLEKVFWRQILFISSCVLSHFSCVAHQAPLSMGFSRQKYWSGLPFPSPGDLPNPRIKPVSPALQVDSLPLRQQGSPN